MAPDNPKLLQAQARCIWDFWARHQWDSSLSPDHILKLEDLNPNLLIDHHQAAWVHCPGRGPDVPTMKALYLPIKYRHPVICHFRQRNPDLSVRDQVQRLQENYCWWGIRGDLAEPTDTCKNCKILKQFKKTPEIPNAIFDLDLHGPFRSYGENKFVLTLIDEATKLTTFEAIKDKSAVSLAWTWTIFAHWIFKMAIPQVINTNLNDHQAENLKKWTSCLNNQHLTTRSSTSKEDLVITKKQLTSSTKWLPRRSSAGKISYRP